jgi:hypothetical protein
MSDVEGLGVEKEEGVMVLVEENPRGSGGWTCAVRMKWLIRSRVTANSSRHSCMAIGRHGCVDHGAAAVADNVVKDVDTEEKDGTADATAVVVVRELCARCNMASIIVLTWWPWVMANARNRCDCARRSSRITWMDRVGCASESKVGVVRRKKIREINFVNIRKHWCEIQNTRRNDSRTGCGQSNRHKVHPYTR